MPYQVDTYGNYRPLGLVYFMAGALKIFGNTIFAVRLPNVLFGVGCVVLIYIFLHKIFQKKKIALLSALLLAVSPWHIFLSRASAEPVMAMFFILLGFILMINFWKTSRKKYLFLTYLVFFTALFTYTGVLPLIFLLSAGLAGYLFFQTKKIKWCMVLPFVALIIFPIIPVYLTNPGYFNGRFKQTSFFAGQGSQGIKLVTEEQIREVGFNRTVYQNFVNRFFHNVPVNTLHDVLNNWTKHLSFSYLYFKGGEPNRLQVPQTGVFMPLEALFLIGGLLFAFQHKKYALVFLGTVIIMISFLPAGLTFEEVPSTHRTIFAAIGFFIFEGYFLYVLATRIFAYRGARWASILIILILAYQMSFYLHSYLVLQPRHRNWFRHPEMNEIARYIYLNNDKYDNIYVVKNSTEPAYFYYFFNNLDPRPFIENKTKSHLQSWSDGKIHYVHNTCASVDNSAGSKLIIERVECANSGTFIKYIVNFDGTKIMAVTKR